MRTKKSKSKQPAEQVVKAIRIEQHGYADDSVSGKRIFAAARLDEPSGTWQLTDHWHQIMCARGSRAGQWTTQPCE